MVEAIQLSVMLVIAAIETTILCYLFRLILSTPIG